MTDPIAPVPGEAARQHLERLLAATTHVQIGDYGPVVELTPALPDVPFHVGIGSGPIHAVEHRYADSPRRQVSTVCGTAAVIGRTAGAFDRGNPWLAIHRLCPTCAWTVAIAQGTTADELVALTPVGAELAALGRAVPDPLLVVRICKRILALAVEREVEEGPAGHLLGHVTAHKPVLLLHEDCTEDACDHDRETEDCYGEHPTVACMACSVLTGSWAGEYEGQVAVLVPAPCAVLPAVAAHYDIPAVAS